MAVKLADVVEEMKAVIVAGAQYQSWERSDRILSLSAEFLLKALARDETTGRVAILMLLPEFNQLTFAYPRYLAQGNTLPVDHESFAGRVLLRKEMLIENNVPDEPHKDFFERIPDESGNIRPIQKMLAAPLVNPEGNAIGVVEVSRTGNSAAEAGPDFTSQDAANLGKCCKVFTQFIAKTWTRERGY